MGGHYIEKIMYMDKIALATVVLAWSSLRLLTCLVHSTLQFSATSSHLHC